MAANPQAETESAVSAGDATIGLAESLEEVRQEFRSDAGALSPTVSSMCELMRSSLTSTRPPFSENLMAFEHRFHSTCRRRSGSPDTSVPRGSTMTLMRIRRASAAGCAVSTAFRGPQSTSPPAGRSAAASPTRFATRRARLSINCVRALAFLTIVSIAWPCLPGSSLPVCIRRAYPTIALSGVRGVRATRWRGTRPSAGSRCEQCPAGDGVPRRLSRAR